MSDRRRVDSRGVSNVMGFLFVFALIIMTISLWQAQMVPVQNGQTEQAHSERVKLDIETVHNTILGLGGRRGGLGYTESVAVELGTYYQPRGLFVNPGPVMGTLRTTSLARDGVADFLVEGAQPGSLCNGTSKHLSYSPSYKQYDGMDIRYENLYLYRHTGTADTGATTNPVTLSRQNMLVQVDSADTTYVNVIRLTGNYSVSSPGSKSVTLSTTNMSQANYTDQEITLNFTSGVADEVWNSNESPFRTDEYPSDITVTEDSDARRVQLTIDATGTDETVNLQCSVVEISAD